MALGSTQPLTEMSGVKLSPTGSAATTDILYQPLMTEDGDCGAVVRMNLGRRNKSTQGKHVKCLNQLHYCVPEKFEAVSEDVRENRTG